MIGQRTHFINDKSSCIDLLFTPNSNLLSKVRVKKSIYDECHHNIIDRSLPFDIAFSPPSCREVQAYKNKDSLCAACNFMSKLECSL